LSRTPFSVIAEPREESRDGIGTPKPLNVLPGEIDVEKNGSRVVHVLFRKVDFRETTPEINFCKVFTV
jgi:hypothetical protein